MNGRVTSKNIEAANRWLRESQKYVNVEPLATFGHPGVKESSWGVTLCDVLFERSVEDKELPALYFRVANAICAAYIYGNVQGHDCLLIQITDNNRSFTSKLSRVSDILAKDFFPSLLTANQAELTGQFVVTICTAQNNQNFQKAEEAMRSFSSVFEKISKGKFNSGLVVNSANGRTSVKTTKQSPQMKANKKENTKPTDEKSNVVKTFEEEPKTRNIDLSNKLANRILDDSYKLISTRIIQSNPKCLALMFNVELNQKSLTKSNNKLLFLSGVCHKLTESNGQDLPERKQKMVTVVLKMGDHSLKAVFPNKESRTVNSMNDQLVKEILPMKIDKFELEVHYRLLK